MSQDILSRCDRKSESAETRALSAQEVAEAARRLSELARIFVEEAKKVNKGIDFKGIELNRKQRQRFVK
jgi:hypothetical protein